MKTAIKYTLLLFLLLGINSGLLAQIPENPEDISPLLIGESIPQGALVAPDGSDHSISEIIKNQPTVLLFYRGGWCPYCNAHLSEIQAAESKILKLGFQIVAVSPDSPDNLRIATEENDLKYHLFSDTGAKFIQQVGIAFQAPENYSNLLSDKSDGENPGILPVPSVFILNTEGQILFEYINPNYKIRLKSSMLLAILKGLNKSE